MQADDLQVEWPEQQQQQQQAKGKRPKALNKKNTKCSIFNPQEKHTILIHMKASLHIESPKIFAKSFSVFLSFVWVDFVL